MSQSEIRNPKSEIKLMALRSCVVIPTYNAAKTLGPLIRQIKPMGLDVIVVNDGSTDDTAQIATASGALVISHLDNQGKGVALRAGFTFALQAGYDAVVTMDSDGQHDPAEIPRLLAAASSPQAAVVVGHRSVNHGSMPRIRRWTNQLMSWVVSRVTRQRIPDSQCGFRVIRREVLAAVRLSSRRFDIETELLLAASRGGWTVTSVPIRTIYQHHTSYIRPVGDGLRFCWLVLRYLCCPPRAR